MIHIQSPTPDLKKSTSFYEKLNFSKIDSVDKHLFTNGHVIIEINEEKTSRIEIKVSLNTYSRAEIEKQACIIKSSSDLLITDYSGVWIRVVDERMNDTVVTNNAEPCLLGNYGGISIETPDIGQSKKLWQLLGFESFMGNVEQGWLSLKNKKGDVISLMSTFMCPHLFFNPSLTFFNGKKNSGIIDKIRTTGVDIAEEITHFNDQGFVDNVILRDPGGLGMFVFNDE